MTTPAQDLQEHGSRLADAFDIQAVTARLCDAGGGYEIVYDSAWLQIGVYALFAPEPDHQRTNHNDELYVVVEGRGMLDVEGEQIELREGHAAFVAAGANYRFTAYEQLSVVVISQKGHDDIRRSVVTPLKPEIEPHATRTELRRASEADSRPT
jgi:mannose-6-phosphate isomerase-like protein (cupin superfamily)